MPNELMLLTIVILHVALYLYAYFLYSRIMKALKEKSQVPTNIGSNSPPRHDFDEVINDVIVMDENYELQVEEDRRSRKKEAIY